MKRSHVLLVIGAGCLTLGLVQPLNAQAGTTRYNIVVPLGLPRPAPVPQDNIPTNEGVALGQKLFNDTRLSINNTQSCASCHAARAAFDDTRQFSIGAEGTKGTRNALSIVNLVYSRSPFFWDGRSPTLRAQALQPIQNPVEMHETLDGVVSKLQADATYVTMFARAFGSAGITSDRIGLAIEQYEVINLSGNSRCDLATAGQTRLTPLEARGQQVFFTPFNPPQGQFGGDCARCHGGPLFTNFGFINNGMPANPADTGRGAITGQAGDNYKFKVPSLRNIAVTAPYMHDGSLQTLEQVVQHYSNGIQHTPNLDPGLARQPGGVQLSAADQQALVAFLKTLTDPKFGGINRNP